MRKYEYLRQICLNGEDTHQVAKIEPSGDVFSSMLKRPLGQGMLKMLEVIANGSSSIDIE